MRKNRDILTKKTKQAVIVISSAVIGIPAAEAEIRSALEQVIVSAQRRDEGAQDVPMALTAIGESALKDMGFTNFGDLSNKVPALDIQPYFLSSSTLEIYMRGVGQQDPSQLARDNGVGVYIDDVYVGHGNGLATELGDVERVEVLPGPQGTLYGRNTIGGAVKFIQAKPTGTFGFKQSIDVGNFGLFRSVSNINLPEIENVSTKFTILKSDMDGWVNNTGSGGDFGKKEAKGARAAVRWQPLGSLTLNYVYDYSKLAGTPQYQQHQYANIEGWPFPIFSDRQSKSWRPVDVPHTDNFIGDGHALTAEWDITDLIYLKSITAYRKTKANNLNDAVEAFGIPVFQSMNTQQHQVSQEVLLTGENDASTIRYHLGAFYFNEAGDQQYANSDIFNRALDEPYIPPMLSDLPPASEYHVRNKSAAIFANLTWVPPILDEAFTIDVGGRYSKDWRYLSQFNPLNVDPAPLYASGSASYGSFDPSATVDYKWSDAVHTYVKVARAYRAGGFDPLNSVLPIPYKPEHLISYEAGIKSQWLKDRLLINADVFSAKYTDIQLTFYNPLTLNSMGGSQTVNGGHARISGVEMEIQFIPVDGLNLNAHGSYLKSDSTSTDPFNFITTKGQLPNTPKWKYNLAAQYTWPFMSVGKMSALVSYDYRDKELLPGVDSATDSKKPAYGLIDSRLTLSEINFDQAELSLSLWGKNLADKDYQSYHAFGAVVYGEPRSYGVSITLNY